MNKLSLYSERVLLTLWVGGLWVAGYVVAPILFTAVDDRQLAGQLAGQVFRVMSYIGLGCGGLLLLSAVLRVGSDWAKQWRLWVLLLMLLLVAVGAFVLQPMMQALKAEGVVAGSVEFGRLHGISSLLFLVTSLLGLLLVAVGFRSPTTTR